MKRFLPQTVAGQLIVLFVIVLLGAQALNLSLLIGERQGASRASHYQTVIGRVIDEARMFGPIDRADLPIQLSTPGSRAGLYFLSASDRTASIPDGTRLRNYETRLNTALREAGVEPLNVSVLRHKLQPSSEGAPAPGTAGEEAQFRDPNAPPGPPPFGQPPMSGGPAGNPPPLGTRPEGAPPPPGMNGPRGGAGQNQGLEEVVMSVEVRPGVWLNAMAPHYASDFLTNRALIATAVTLLVAIGALILFSRRIVNPIRKLAEAADQFGRGVAVDPVAETGPDDIKTAARAFNGMQNRLTRLLETQRTMLRAVGHDLRTPITTLRIRAESLPDEHGREKFISTLKDMTVMTDEMLDWAKDASGMESSAPLDVSALLASMTDDYSDQGRDVVFAETEEPHILTCRRVSLRRAVGNLVDNALKYGTRARIGLKRKNGTLEIYVDDDGPGVPEDRIADTLKPFTRLEASRNKQTGGIGLGLSIAQTIVEAHGGRLALFNRSEGGLRAQITLPLQS